SERGESHVHMKSISNLAALVHARASHDASRIAFTYLGEGDGVDTTLTYGELDRGARLLAARLIALGLAGERALLIYPPGLDYVVAVCGCLYAGMVAVPAYPPDPSRLQRTLPRLQAIA